MDAIGSANCERVQGKQMWVLGLGARDLSYSSIS